MSTKKEVKEEKPKVKCPGCHAYFVEKGEVCTNCTNAGKTAEDFE